MSQTHTPALNVRLGKKSKAYWSLNPSRHAIVFVHGFNGHATNTWIDFPGQMLIHPEFRGCDLIFFGYASSRRTDKSARDFRVFLEAVLDNSLNLINTSLADENFPTRLRPFSFNKVTIIAHSLGANVVRHALTLHALNEQKTWPVPIEMMLLAPAHKGAKLLPLVMEVALAIKYGGVATTALKALVPVFNDLEEDCKFLEKLSDRTEEALNKHHLHLRAKLVLSAEDDAVVNDVTFLTDPTAKEMAGTSHTSVCKPNLLYTKPVRELMNIL